MSAADPLRSYLATLVDERVEAAVRKLMSDGWTPHTRSPLGARRTATLCREGSFPGARKVGKRWLIPTVELDGWIREHGQPGVKKVEPTAEKPDAWCVEAMAERIGLGGTTAA